MYYIQLIQLKILRLNEIFVIKQSFFLKHTIDFMKLK